MANMTLKQVRYQLRSEVELIERDRFQYPEDAYHTSSSTLDDLADAIDAVIKQHEQDAKDAARYRWLRNESGRNGMPYIRCDDPPFEPMDYWITAGTADRCIDLAMAKESGNG